MSRLSPGVGRRGSTAVEFGLVLPVLLVVLLAIFDFAWTFFQHGILTRALRDGCRSGAVVPLTGDPIATATADIQARMTAAGFACGGGGCAPTVSLATSGSLDVLECVVSVPVLGLTGFTPILDGITVTAATRLNLESWSPT